MEIKVGDFIRSNDGYIGRIIEIKKARRGCDTYYCTDKTMASGFYEHIRKHSPNIIDLIEQGDYVNGSRILDITGDYINATEWNCCKSRLEKTIKSIVTKEQFNQMKYIVGE